MATGGWPCVGCAKTNPKTARFCAGCGTERATEALAVVGPTGIQRPKSDRARYLDERDHDVTCRIHKIALDETGYCAAAEAWWVPQYRCPHCAGPLWDNGFCPTCTPRRGIFPGDYFEQRWEANAGREWGHYVRVHRGPTPVQTPGQVEAHLTELRTLTGRVGRAVGQAPAREPGDEEPAWVTEDAPHG